MEIKFWHTKYHKIKVIQVRSVRSQEFTMLTSSPAETVWIAFPYQAPTQGSGETTPPASSNMDRELWDKMTS